MPARRSSAGTVWRLSSIASLLQSLPNVSCEESPSTFVGEGYFDNSWIGSGRFCATAVNVLSLDRFHLVVHDIGRPVGFELAEPSRDRIASLTVPGTLVDVDTIKRSWSMEPFARLRLGEVYLRALTKPAVRLLMRLQGMADVSQVSAAELDAYVDLLRRDDSGLRF
jgi:haloalkane dehalogenase